MKPFGHLQPKAEALPFHWILSGEKELNFPLVQFAEKTFGHQSIFAYRPHATLKLRLSGLNNLSYSYRYDDEVQTVRWKNVVILSNEY